MITFSTFYENTGNKKFYIYECGPDESTGLNGRAKIQITQDYYILATDIDHAVIDGVIEPLAVTGVMWYTPDAIVIDLGEDNTAVVTPYELDDHGVTKIIFTRSHREYRVDIAEFVDKIKSKKAALHGSNDEAGLGDMLDVL